MGILEYSGEKYHNGYKRNLHNKAEAMAVIILSKKFAILYIKQSVKIFRNR